MRTGKSIGSPYLSAEARRQHANGQFVGLLQFFVLFFSSEDPLAIHDEHEFWINIVRSRIQSP